MISTKKITLTGWDAIEAKSQDESIVLHNYNTPTDPSADDITEERARELAHEDPTLIWCDIEVAQPDRESLIKILQKISYPVVAFDQLTGRWSIMSGLTDHWRAPWVIEVSDNPSKWASNLFADQDAYNHPTIELDGCTDEWLMEYATGD